MKVLCVNNTVSELDEEARGRIGKYIRNSSGPLSVDVGSFYIVYGIVFRDNSPWYYLCTSEDCEYPVPFPSELFNVTDGRFFPLWTISSSVNLNGTVSSILAYEEWAKNSYYYENLLEGDPEAVKSFLEYKKLMDEEI